MVELLLAAAVLGLLVALFQQWRNSGPSIRLRFTRAWMSFVAAIVFLISCGGEPPLFVYGIVLAILMVSAYQLAAMACMAVLSLLRSLKSPSPKREAKV